jgi:hypothetical protein
MLIGHVKHAELALLILIGHGYISLKTRIGHPSGEVDRMIEWIRRSAADEQKTGDNMTKTDHPFSSMRHSPMR